MKYENSYGKLLGRTKLLILISSRTTKYGLHIHKTLHYSEVRRAIKISGEISRKYRRLY